MKLEDIPRREEALIVAEAQQRIDRLIITDALTSRLGHKSSFTAAMKPGATLRKTQFVCATRAST